MNPSLAFHQPTPGPFTAATATTADEQDVHEDTRICHWEPIIGVMLLITLR